MVWSATRRGRGSPERSQDIELVQLNEGLNLGAGPAGHDRNGELAGHIPHHVAHGVLHEGLVRIGDDLGERAVVIQE